jgi:uncharacterized damage-inducible protein DinB
MRNPPLILAFCVTFAAGTSARQEAIPTTLHGSLAGIFELSQQEFLAVAEAMPEDKYGFIPKDGAFEDARSFGEQVRHVACANVGFFNEIEGKAPPEACEREPKDVKTKAQLVAYLKDAFSYGNRVLATVDAGTALQRADGRYGGPNTKLGIASIAIWHLADHYGQLVVYLRMNGIVPPPTKQYGVKVR